jgi:pimeloyl-ACP methyl ester carboxylesterase
VPAPQRSRIASLVAIAALLAACASPVGVRREDPETVHRELTANVLSAGRPSDRTYQLLERFGLRERFEKEPAAVLAELHAGLQPTGDHRRLSGLAELSFYHGERSGDGRYQLAAAVYAYALLFPGPGGETLDPSDPRVRLAYDLYNRALTSVVSAEAGKGRRQLELPFGTLDLEIDEAEFSWAGHRFGDMVDAANYSVRGLRDRYRRPGIGAPFAATLGSLTAEPPPGAEWLVPAVRVPTTVVMRLDGARAALPGGQLTGRIEVFTPDEASTTGIDGQTVPIEFETTFALAETLAGSEFFDFELKGFFMGAFRPLRAAVIGTGHVEEEDSDQGLFFLEPYRPGRIPVVLVHGTASSPGRWGDLVNELANDRAIATRYQFWLFLYNTGNPIGYSGGRLRHALETAVERLDPQGRDAALREMVVIGHSQGGLLTKLTAVESGDAFWDRVSRVPIDELDLSDEVRETLRGSLFYTPAPFVKRVVFVCTPHGGSYLASFSLAGLLADLVALPSNLAQVGLELALRNPGNLLLGNVGRLPTSIDNMTPGNPFLQALDELPVAPEIASNSIIAVRGSGPPEEGSDGVVSYESAHIDGVESEFIVRSGHSAQSNPEVIQEVRRILLAHAARASAASISEATPLHPVAPAPP